jgi:uncharacterized protein
MNSNTVAIAEQNYGELIDQSMIDAIVQEIVKHSSPQQVFLFGSYATGQSTPDSDLDLLVVMETDLPKPKRATPLRLLFRPVPCSMDILVYTPEEVACWNGTVNHIITTAFQTGKRLYDQSTT